MPVVPIQNLGSVGLMRDTTPYDLPAQAFTDCRNVTFRSGVVAKTPTWRSTGDTGATAYALFLAPSGDARYWVVCRPDKVYSFYKGTNTEITRISGNYTGTSKDPWNGGMLNGIFVLNNGVDVPQMWDLPGGAADLVDLPNWQSTVRAKVIRPFRNFLIALDVTKSGTRDRRLVKWSHPAAPLTVPQSWDESDPARDTGEISLAEGEDGLVDGLGLGNAFIIYADTQAWAMQFIGGQEVFAFRKIFAESGLLAQGCVVSFSRKHFVVSADDFVVHDGTNIESVAPDRVRKWFFSQLNPTYYNITRVIQKVNEKEIWVVFPTDSSGTLNQALVWNWQYNTWGVRDVPPTRAVASAHSTPDTQGATWDVAGDTWSTASGEWGESSFGRATDRLGVVGADDFILYEYKDAVEANDSHISFIERRGLPLKGMGRAGEPVLDPSRMALLRGVWTYMNGPVLTPMRLTVGTQTHREGSIVWHDTKSFVIGQNHTPIYVPYRYLSYRIEDLGGKPWELSSVAFDIAPMGAF